MAELGLRSYRFSIAWAHIFPNGTSEINPEGIAFNHLIDKLLKYQNVPFFTKKVRQCFP